MHLPDHRFIPVILSIMILSGCYHKEIVWPGNEEREISVSFMWNNAPTAKVDGMTVYFFPINTEGRIWRFDISGQDGGPVSLPTGCYRMIAVNNDLPGITISGQDSYSGLMANAREADNANTVRPTGMIYRGIVDNIQVTPCGISYTQGNGSMKECPKGLIRCAPDSMATVYRIEATNITGIEHVRAATASLDGVAMSQRIWADESCGNTCRTTIPMTIGNSNDNIMSAMTTGFSAPSPESKFTLTITIARKDGKTLVKNFDVTDQVANSKYPRNVLITIDGLEIPSENPPDPPSGDDGDNVGITVGVDGWSVIDIYL